LTLLRHKKSTKRREYQKIGLMEAKKEQKEQRSPLSLNKGIRISYIF